MKLIFILLVLLSLFAGFQSIERRIRKSSFQTRHKVRQFCEKDLGFSLYIENGNPRGHLRRECKTINYAAVPYSNCLSNTKLFPDSSYKRTSVLELSPYPVETIRRILKFSDCQNKFEVIQKIYEKINFGLNLIKSGPVLEIGANLKPTFSQDATQQFYDVPHNYVLYMNSPDVNYAFLIDQFNRAPGIDYSNRIVLNQENDLLLEKMGVYTRPFVAGTVHELMNLCYSNGKGNYYFFLVHRGKAHGWTFSTIVHYFYYGTSDSCNKMADSIDPKTKLKAEYDMTLSSDTVRKFSSLFELTKIYEKNKSLYRIFTKNCQHFATGFYNTLTGEHLSTTNFNLNPIPKFNKINDALDAYEKGLKTKKENVSALKEFGAEE